MPETMRALRAHRRGGPEELVVDTVPIPELQADEVLIEVHAAAITFAELNWDETWEHVPTIPGHEFSGVVIGRGSSVRAPRIGDPVYGLIRFERQGAAADYVTVPAADVAPKPSALTHAQAASMPLAALTAWQGLYDHAKVLAGERVLIHGGTGGVGAFAVQLAAHLGAEVTATVRGSRAVALCRELGADHVINTDADDFTSRGRAFDVVFDTIGGDVLDRSYDVIVSGGRLITLQAPPDASRADSAQVSATFFIVSPDVEELTQLAHLADDGRLQVTIAATFPLDQGRAAFESGTGSHRASGKTVLVVRD
jgi:NADPH:quinone reductase-like Zn-dependent oxidoreductase